MDELGERSSKFDEPGGGNDELECNVIGGDNNDTEGEELQNKCHDLKGKWKSYPRETKTEVIQFYHECGNKYKTLKKILSGQT